MNGINIEVTSVLASEYLDDLQNLLFFHPQQARFRRSISDSIAKHGSPQIVELQGHLRIELAGLPGVQSLYAVSADPKHQQLLGAVVYTRRILDELEILHIVARHDHTLAGGGSEDSVAFLLVEELYRIARQVKGVRAVRLAYDRGKVIIRSLETPCATHSHS